jgi:hypothetical protein
VRGGARWGAIAFVLAAACAGGAGSTSLTLPPSPVRSAAAPVALPNLPASVLPGYVVHDTSLDAATLSTDALDPASLSAVLSDAGFDLGIERRFTARGKALTEVVARVLHFRSPRGARSYLAWIRGHGDDLLGSRTKSADGPGVPGAVAFFHGVSGCCTKDTFQYFAAWSRGTYALTLRIGGPHAGVRSAIPLARALEARLRKET